MNETLKTNTIAPPRLIASLTAGFNLVAARAYLILLPVGLDLLLWFGPRFRLKQLMQPLIQDWVDTLQTTGGNDLLGMSGAIQQFWGTVLERFNLLTFLSSTPVGVPSLLAGVLPVRNPLGEPPVYEIHSWGQALSGWLLFSLLGLVAGSLYFSMVARSTAPEDLPYSLPQAIWEFGQVFSLTILLIFLLMLLSIPISIVSLILALINPALAQLALLLMSFVLLWLLIPLVFSPHGIFAAHQGVMQAMLISARVVRLLFPGVLMFLLAALVLTQGMGYLWHIPPETSWLMLAGILGNAFITTGLLAASFVYYRKAVQWVEAMRRESLTRG